MMKSLIHMPVASENGARPVMLLFTPLLRSTSVRCRNHMFSSTAATWRISISSFDHCVGLFDGTQL